MITVNDVCRVQAASPVASEMKECVCVCACRMCGASGSVVL